MKPTKREVKIPIKDVVQFVKDNWYWIGPLVKILGEQIRKLKLFKRIKERIDNNTNN